MPDPNLATNKVGTPVTVSPQPGMTYPVRADADPTGKIVTGASTLLSLPQAGYTTALPPATTFSTMYIQNAAYDVSVTSFTGGTTPSVTFLLDRLGADGNWYGVLPAAGQSGAVTVSAGTVTASLDIGLLPQASAGSGTTSLTGSAHCVFTQTARARWTFAGSPAPGTVTFSMSVIGR